MNDVVAIVLAGGAGRRMGFLTEECCKSALTFGGKYRIIDFALSNCANSGVTRVGLAVQYLPRSLLDYVGRGEPWGLDRGRGGLTVLQPSPGRSGGGWYEGTAGAVFRNLDFVDECEARDVLVVSGSRVSRIDFGPLIEFHRAMEAGCTIGVPTAPPPIVRRRRGTVPETDATARGGECIGESRSASADGVFVFRRDALEDILQGLSSEGVRGLDLSEAGLERTAERHRVRTFPLHGYQRDIDTIASYYQAHQDLLLLGPPLVLDGCDSRIRTRTEPRAPARFGPHAAVEDSLISEGTVIEGAVRHSIVSPGVRICADARVEDSIVLEDVVVSQAATLRRCIVDKGAWIGPRAVIGDASGRAPDADAGGHRCLGITVVGRQARVAGGTWIGCGCRVGPGVREDDFRAPILACGGSVFPERLTYLWVG